MSREDRVIRHKEIEEAIINSSGEIGTILDLETVIDNTYRFLGQAFWGNLGVNDRDYQINNGHTPSAEIVMATHNLIEWQVFEWLADRRLKLLTQQNNH